MNEFPTNVSDFYRFVYLHLSFNWLIKPYEFLSGIDDKEFIAVTGYDLTTGNPIKTLIPLEDFNEINLKALFVFDILRESVAQMASFDGNFFFAGSFPNREINTEDNINGDIP